MAKQKRIDRNLVLIVQQIRTYWSKQSRGNPGATKRNAIPEVLPIGKEGLARVEKQGSSLFHIVQYDEFNNFQPLIQYGSPLPVCLPYGCVTVEANQELLFLTYEYNSERGWAPSRYNKLHTLQCPPGKWAQVRENGRFTGDWDIDWRYQKVVTNAGLFSALSENVFTSEGPFVSYSSLEDLW